MQEIQIPAGVKVSISEDGQQVLISGKLGSTAKPINERLMSVKLDSSKITITETKNKKLERNATLAIQAFSSELKSAMDGVEKGMERKMKIIFAHFPMSIEIKGNAFFAKNVLGEKKPRVAKIMGSTKVEVKGQDVTVRGVDPYDVGQTAANIHKLSFVRKKDSRVFQDGIFFVGEE